MKRFSLIIIFLTLILVSPLWAGEMGSVTMKVEGMSCKMCIPAVKKALYGVKGVKKVSVDFETKKAQIEYEKDVADAKKLIDALKRAGFTAGVEKRKETE